MMKCIKCIIDCLEYTGCATEIYTLLTSFTYLFTETEATL